MDGVDQIAAGDLTLATLTTHGVPFATYDADGQRRHVSCAARLLLDADVAGSLVWAQATRLVRSTLLTSCARMRVERVSPVPTPMPNCWMSVHIREPAAFQVSAVVVLHPAPVRRDPHAVPLAGFGLTSREHEVARLVAAGRSAKEIGAALAISVHTARRHTERVFTKLGVQGRVAVALALTLHDAPQWP